MSLDPVLKPFLSGGLGDTSNAGLDKFVPEIWGASIMDYMEKSLVFGNLANDWSAMVANGGDLIHLPKHSELQAEDLYGTAAAPNNEAIRSGISFSQVTTNEGEYTLTVDQSKYAAVSITDIAKTQSSYDVMNIYTRKLGYALGKKIDYYLAKQLFESVAYNYANNSDNDGAQAGNVIKLTAHNTYNINKDGVANMITGIYEADSNIEDWTMVLVPQTYGSLFKNADFARYDAVGASLGSQVPLISGYAGKLGGVNVIVSNNFVDYGEASTSDQQTASPVGNFKAGTTADESEKLAGYLVHKDALNIAYAAGMKARVQSDYDLTSLSTRFVADTVYGCLVVGSTTNKKVFALTMQDS